MHYLRRGFTLVEMLIVLVIIAILFSFLYPYYERYTMRANFAEVAVLSEGVMQALEACFRTKMVFAQCSDGGGHANDPTVLLAWNNLVTLRGTDRVDTIAYTEHANYGGAGKELIQWIVALKIEGRKDSSGKQLLSDYIVQFWRDPKDGSFEIHNPASSSPCVQDGWCKAKVSK